MDDTTLTVRELADGIADAIASAFPAEVWVQGEIFSLRRTANGHVYFQLIEPGPPGRPPRASIDVVLFSSVKARVNDVLRAAGGVRMTDGMRVRIEGRVEMYAPQGKVQLILSAVDPAYTLGVLATERERVLRALTAEGLLERNRAHALPAGPLRVGLLTSDGSAAMADFVHELEASGLRWHVLLADARMQGTGAERSVLAALERLERAGVDAVALVRGGGARTDLATFDSELVARAIAHCIVPVLTGIGHETDRSVSDEVAHTACKTPTACAGALVAHVHRGHDVIEQQWQALCHRAGSLVTARAEQVRRAALSVAGQGRSRLALEDQMLDGRARRLQREMTTCLSRAGARLQLAEARQVAADPARALARGWSITRTATGTVVRRADQIRAGDLIVTTLASGELHSRVTASDEHRERP